ncbi:hypothetical protein K1719_013944 [Acacia pycnantha]|nr:hypothetical protein K1719_013944 [Acacia pycnantha]
MDMPHDIVIEIFSWLPAKSIYKFKCVNKFCNTLSSLEDTHFAHKQSQKALLRDDSCFFLQPRRMQRYGANIEFHHLSSKNKTSGASHGFFQFLEHYPNCTIIASSKGLILIRNDTELFICNPITQSWLPIPTPDYVEKYSGADLEVVFDCNVEDSNDFMLFLFEYQDDWASQYIDLKFYSVKEDRSSRMIRIPKEARNGSHDFTCQMRIYKWGKPTSSDESICLVRLRKNVFTIWVLTDYDIGKWRRIFKIRVKAMGVKEEDPIIIKGFIVMNGDQLIFATEMKIYGYGLRQENFMELEEICEYGFRSYLAIFTAFSDTLRPCGHTALTLPLMQQH